MAKDNERNISQIWQTYTKWLSSKVNWAMVPIKMAYFFLGMGFWSIIIYSTLQARSIGLSFNDIGIVLGVLPVAGALANPILGFLGDKIGLKPILLGTIIGMGVCGTFIDLTPRYKEYLRRPNALLTSDNISEGSFILRSVQWPTDYPNCNNRENHDLALCDNATPVINASFYDDLINYLDCKNEAGDVVEITLLDTSLFRFPSNNSLVIADLPLNGTFCDLYANYVNNITERIFYCDIIERPEVGQCFNTDGSHAATFFTYFFLRIVQAVCVNTMFSLMDGTSMHLVKQHNSDYAMVLIWNTVAGVFGPMISGALVVDSSDPSVEANYQTAYYISDGFLAICCFIMLLFLDIKVEKNKESLFYAFRRIINPASATFLLIMLVAGIGWGVLANYTLVYLQEEMGASSAMIGIATSIGFFSCLVMTPFARKSIALTGDVNMILLSTTVVGVEFILYAFIVWIPPYHLYILSLLQFLILQYNWISCVQYSYRIAPPTLVATVIALNSAVQHILGYGIGGFIGGQLVDNLGCSLPLLFNITAGFLFVSMTVLYFVYRLLCKKYEEQLIQQKEDEIYRLQVNKRQDVTLSPTLDNFHGEVRDREIDSHRIANTTRNPKFEDSMKYLGSQIIGIARL